MKIDIEDIAITWFLLVISALIFFIFWETVSQSMTPEQVTFTTYCLKSDEASKNQETEFCKKGWPK